VRDYEGALDLFQSVLGLLAEEEGQDSTEKPNVSSRSGLTSFKFIAQDATIENFKAAFMVAWNDLNMRRHITVLLSQTLWTTGTEEGREAANRSS
jgi:superkiller protein 3